VLQRGVVNEIAGGAGQHDPTIIDNICPVGNLKGLHDILLDQEDRQPLPIQFPDKNQYLLDQQRRG
jgi:hypothetical protein